MHHKKDISIRKTLRGITLLLVMLLVGSINALAQEEKVIYSTDFQDWEQADHNINPDIPVVVDKTTTDGQPLTFSINNCDVVPDTIYKDDKNGIYGKINNPIVTKGWLCGLKTLTAEGGNGTLSYFETSVLRSVTKLNFIEGATGGGTRGWNIAYRLKGETNWTTIYTNSVGTANGKLHTVDINKENVQLRFFNMSAGQMAFVTSFEIYGNVDPVSMAKVAYYDTDGTSLIGENAISAEGDAKYPKLTYQYGANDVALAGENVFRGWFNGIGNRAAKVKEGTELYSDINLYAKATPKEEAADGTEYFYDLRLSSWYPEDHDVVSIDKGTYKGIHGWEIQENGSFKIDVASYAEITIKQCKSGGSNGKITVTDSDGNEIAQFDNYQGSEDYATTISYQGGKPTTLTFSMSANTNIHSIEIVNFRPVWATFKFANDKIEGVCPDPVRGNDKGEITMPNNTSFYRQGWTFQGWTDGTNTYDKGKTYTFSDNITLYPKFVENTIDLTETDGSTAIWQFDNTKAPALNAIGAANPIVYTSSVLVADETQDIGLTIDTKSGGITNTDAKLNKLVGEGAAVYDGTVFKVRAIYGMTVQVHASDKIDTENGGNTTIFGTGVDEAKFTLSDADMANTDYTIEDDGKTITMVYRGNATTLEFAAAKLGSNDVYGFIKDITVTYPMLPDVWVKGFISDKDATKYPNEKDGNAGTARVLSTTTYSNTGNRYKIGDELTIVATPSYGYKVVGYRENKFGSVTDLPTTEYTDTVTGEKKLATIYTVTNTSSTTIEAVYQHLPLYKVTAKPSDRKFGSATLSPIDVNFYNEVFDTNDDGSQGEKLYVESWYTEGTEVTLGAETEQECVVDYWTEEDSETHLTDLNTYTFTVGSTDKTFIVHLKQGELGSVVFDISSAHVNGESVASLHQGALSMTIPSITNVRSFTVPTNYPFFKSVDDDDVTNNAYAYHLLYWVDHADNDNRYDIGKTYSFKTQKTITLTPVFAPNPTARTNRVNNPLVRYDFGTNVVEYYDSSTKETRKTCAPEVNIDNNTNTYWTAQAYFEVLANGVLTSHTRDVTMYVNTGNNGYIRNQGLGDWCAFGPGTTFWCTSSVGTTVSILTYSKITTTTIDGVVPTLNETRTAEERQKAGNDHIYVYSYTTQNSATTMPIVIGDDYSYYQWIEVQMLAANMVNQYTTVDDAQHGKIDNVISPSGFGAVELDDGGYSFRKGDRLRISFERFFGFEFDKLVETGKPDDDGNPTTLLKMNDDGTVDMVDDDYVMHHNIPRNADGTWGTAKGDGKTVFTLKAIEPTDEEATDEEATDDKRTTYELEYDITNHHEMEIVFKERPTYYITYNPGKLASGIAPAAQWVEAGDKFTAHTNHTLYYEGNTLAYWVDGDYDESMTDDEKDKHIYHTGVEYTAPAMDMRLYPIFKPNSFNILSLDSEATATWNLTQDEGAPEINYQNTAGILVTQLCKGDEHIDLKIDLDAVDHGNGAGKFNNVSSSERIQINVNSIINFTSTPNCEVFFSVVSRDPSVAMVAGKKKGDEGYTIAADKKSISVVCSGDTAVQQLQMVGDYVYGKKFAITYKPQTATKATIESLSCGETTYDATEIKRQMDADGYITFKVSPWENDNEEIPDIIGKATEKGSVITTKATVTMPQATATVRTSAGITVETYPIEFVFNTPDDTPLFQKVVVNGVTKTETTNTFDDVPSSGIISVTFNRTMAQTKIRIDEQNIESTAEAGKTLSFKYWDLPAGGTIELNITPDLEIFKDIYGKTCQQPLKLILNVRKESQEYNHSKFDFVVGTDGNMDEAIAAANSNTKADGERYYIFVPDGEWKLEGNNGNGMTKILKSNVSLIGQSKDGTTVWNKSAQEGSNNTATIFIERNLTDFYCEDLTLQNRYDYWNSGGGAGRAVVFHDRGTRSIMKNVSLDSYQDTYYSQNSNLDFRGYFENCDIWGVVDFLCGNGDIWFEKCNLILRDRAGNNICAPAQDELHHMWGYVFNNCTIKPDVEKPQQLKDKGWTLGRPWNDSPAATYLNTTMVTIPTDAGWQRMSTDLKLRLHEYRSMDANGNLISLGQRTLASCAPGVGSDDCVLTAAQAAQYTLRNVVGGSDGFEPQSLCRQIDAASSAQTDRDENNVVWQDEVEMDDDILRWNYDERALCYFVFKYNQGKWEYILNTTDNYAELSEYGSGYYYVRAANQRGGLGAPTESMLYEILDPYILHINKVEGYQEDGEDYGWQTICLPFNAKVPDGVYVYAATAHNKQTDTDKIEDLKMTLRSVETIDSMKGYVVYGPVGDHYFKPTSRSCDKPTILLGNPSSEPISSANVSCYVLANKAWGLGFYKFAGTSLAAYRGWLPQDMVSRDNQENLALSKRGISFVFADDATYVPHPTYKVEAEGNGIYNMSGQRVESTAQPGLYISRQKGKFIKK